MLLSSTKMTKTSSNTPTLNLQRKKSQRENYLLFLSVPTNGKRGQIVMSNESIHEVHTYGLISEIRIQSLW